MGGRARCTASRWASKVSSSFCGRIREATNIEIEKTGIRDFKRILDKYGVDYAITKSHENPARYLVFFKARDADTLTAAFKDYSAKLVQKEKRPSVLGAFAAVQGPCC